MRKIPTIFARDRDENLIPHHLRVRCHGRYRWTHPHHSRSYGVVNAQGKDLPFNIFDPFAFSTAVATEKLDGTNVRITVRSATLVRLEKRRNPTKAQKKAGITDHWYVDAIEDSAEDRWVWEAARNKTPRVPDGVWEAEAVGPKIQDNPLMLEEHLLYVFSHAMTRDHLEVNVGTSYAWLRDNLHEVRSVVNPEVFIEGVVWHWTDGRMAKIKTRDFK